MLPQRIQIAFSFTHKTSIPTTQGDYELHWGNTLVRLFSEESFNHIEHYTIDNKTLGMRVGQAVLDILFEHDFSYRYDKYPDEATMEWFVKSEVMIMEGEIEELDTYAC